MNSNTFKLIASLIFCLITQNVVAQNCDLDIGYASVSQGERVPRSIDKKLQSKIMSLLSREGLSSSDPNSRFFVTARFDHGYAEIVPSGTGNNYMIVTDLTLFFGDNKTQKIFASTVLSLKGLGDTEERAYTKCLNSLNINNPELKSFVREGRTKIMEYYDSNYSSILSQAKSAMANRNYDEALYYSTSIPECCVGFSEAQQFTLKCYGNLRNYDSANLLSKAKSAWAASPDADGAEEASRYLNQIDPDSSSASAAKALMEEMTRVTKKQWEFENVQKYKDELALRKQSMATEAEIRKQRIAANADVEKTRLRAARDVAVAYAKSRPRVVHHYNWIRW